MVVLFGTAFSVFGRNRISIFIDRVAVIIEEKITKVLLHDFVKS